MFDQSLQPCPHEGPFAAEHPWRRYFARILDITLYSLVFLLLQSFIFRWVPPQNLLVILLTSYINYFFMFCIEPVLLCTWGTTVGKWIFGLVLRNADGQKLSYDQALHRTFLLFSRGLGYGIPIYNLFRFVQSCKQCTANEQTEYDARAGVLYTIKDAKGVRILGYIALYALAFCINVMILLAAQMPIHRGDLTPTQYAQNVNDQIRISGAQTGRRMTPSGRWEDAGTPAAFFGLECNEDHQITTQDGIVTGVSFEVNLTNTDLVYDLSCLFQKQLIVKSFYAAQKDVHFWDFFFAADIKKLLTPFSFEPMSFVADGMQFTYTVDPGGYALPPYAWTDQAADPLRPFTLLFEIKKIP